MPKDGITLVTLGVIVKTKLYINNTNVHSLLLRIVLPDHGRLAIHLFQLLVPKQGLLRYGCQVVRRVQVVKGEVNNLKVKKVVNKYVIRLITTEALDLFVVPLRTFRTSLL